MPKNKGKGGKNRRRGKNESEEKRELILKEPGQEYAQVLRMLGNGRLEGYCFDGKRRLCHIRGKLRKREWATVGDIILIGLRSYQDSKADILRVYNSDEARRLKKMKELPNDAKIDMDDNKKVGNEDVPFDFGEQQNEDEVKDKDEDEEGGVGEQPAERFAPMPTYFDYDEITVSEEDQDSNEIDENGENNDNGWGREKDSGKVKVDLNEL